MPLSSLFSSPFSGHGAIPTHTNATIYNGTTFENQGGWIEGNAVIITNQSGALLRNVGSSICTKYLIHNFRTLSTESSGTNPNEFMGVLVNDGMLNNDLDSDLYTGYSGGILNYGTLNNFWSMSGRSGMWNTGTLNNSGSLSVDISNIDTINNSRNIDSVFTGPSFCVISCNGTFTQTEGSTHLGVGSVNSPYLIQIGVDATVLL